ncbi:MAG: ABC transporter ATP-binding protein [Lachnospiraceae bacterium]|nr:ABC transporter ATP-binding protein [Lachnospiraceae bacterium]
MELELEHITHIYKKGKKALDDVSLRLTPGVYGLLGPNGAGKSTLMNIITTNLIPTSGEALFQGRSILADNRAYRSRLGYMPQQQGMYNQMTGRHFLWYMAALKKIPRQEAKKRIEYMLELVSLKETANQRIGSYSGGMKQRLLIAQAVLNDPEILILDEPTAGLDPKERIRIRNFVSEISQNRIVLLATHVVSDVECIAKEIILLKQGTVIRQKTPAELICEMDGLVWEFCVSAEELADVQKQYRVSNLSICPEGILVRAVGKREEIRRRKRPVRAGLEDVYLYYMEADLGDSLENRIQSISDAEV